MDNYLPVAIINVTTQDELWGQFIDIEQNIKYVNPENDLACFTVSELGTTVIPKNYVF